LQRRQKEDEREPRIPGTEVELAPGDPAVHPRDGVRHVSGSFAPGLHDRADRFSPRRVPAETTDAALIDDVLRTLREGAPVHPALPPQPLMPAGSAGVHGVLLFSDRLPGLAFRPSCYLAPSGEVYLADSVAVTYTRTGPLVQAAWIAASPLFARWATTP
jgi:hypothetical protein